MALVHAKCTACGANLEIDGTQEAAVCKYCGAAFIVEKAVNNYNIANAQINAGTVNINVGMSDFVIEGGVLKKYRGNAEHLVVPDNVITIGAKAFENCISLVTVIANDKVESVGTSAFANCSRLISVTISATRIEKEAFDNCSQLTSVTFKKEASVGECIFRRCHNLIEVNIPLNSTIKTVNEYVFLGAYHHDVHETTVEKLINNINSKEYGYDIVSAFFLLSKSLDEIILKKPKYFEDWRKRGSFKINGQDYLGIYDDRIKEINSKSGCYIATAVYGDYNAPQVLVLRRFRDKTLARSAPGRAFIRTYYRFSPPIADKLKNMRRLNAFVRRILDKFVSHLSKKES
jgi:DNA-directed RNA polymerase subunit RPC12/RpoP